MTAFTGDEAQGLPLFTFPLTPSHFPSELLLLLNPAFAEFSTLDPPFFELSANAAPLPVNSGIDRRCSAKLPLDEPFASPLDFLASPLSVELLRNDGDGSLVGV